MSTYLTVFSIGPVQEFIRAARRTRDLWAGSKILDCISKAAARALVEHHARLIFPHGGASLEDDAAPIANVLLAEIDSDDPGSFSTDLAPAVRRAAQGRWEDLSKEVSESRDWAKYIQTGRFKRQIASVLEINSAWLPLPSPASYRATRRDLMRILSGRKSCRNFDQFAGENGVPKSSLDGARESVWDIDALKTAPGKDRLSLRLNDGEQLDAVGIIKRVAFGKQPFPSVARIAADPWLRGLAPRQRSSLSAVCSNLRLDAWEGSVVFPNRLRELEKSKAWTPAEMDEIRRALKPLFTTNGEPHPYCAVLLADGDSMGATISGIESADAHRNFSRDLSGFAERAWDTVRRHHGRCVYAGGDDVLALLPLDTVIECASALRLDFLDAMRNWQGPTLSVGVAIGHNLEDLEDLLEWARDAEKHAKSADNPVKEERRNALAVHLHPRNGPPTMIRGQWTTGIADSLQTLATAYAAGRVAHGAAFELREMARHYKDWKEHSGLADALRADVKRVLARKAPKQDPAFLNRLRTLAAARCCDSVTLKAFSEEMLVARAIAKAYVQSGRQPGRPL